MRTTSTPNVSTWCEENVVRHRIVTRVVVFVAAVLLAACALFVWGVTPRGGG